MTSLACTQPMAHGVTPATGAWPGSTGHRIGKTVSQSKMGPTAGSRGVGA